MRWWHSKRGSLNPGLVYSPGINCFDADIISVHVVFAQFHRQMENKLRLLRNPISSWPLLIHRRVYYRLIRFLERRIYTPTRVCLVPVSRKVAVSLNRIYQRTENVYVVYYGVDQKQFNPRRRSELRESARPEFGLHENEFAILLIGNDWKSKGLICLMDAVARLANPQVRILVVGKDETIASLAGPNEQFLDPNPSTSAIGYNWGTRNHWAEAIRLHHSMLNTVLPTLHSDLGIPAARTLLLGYSQSVGLNYRFAGTYPKAIGAVVGICGGVPKDWEESDLYQRVTSPILHIARDQDEFFPAEVAAGFKKRLETHATDVTFQMLEGPHRFPSKAADVIVPWMKRVFA